MSAINCATTAEPYCGHATDSAAMHFAIELYACTKMYAHTYTQVACHWEHQSNMTDSPETSTCILCELFVPNVLHVHAHFLYKNL